MIRKTMMLSLLAVLALVLAACGGTTTEGDSNSGSDAGSASAIELSQELVSTDAQGTGLILTASVPEGWVSLTEGQIVAATREELLTGGPSSPAGAGDMLFLAVGVPAEMAGLLIGGEEINPSTLLDSFSTSLLGGIDNLESSSVEEVTIDGKTVAKLSATAATGEFNLYAFEQDSAYVIMVGGSAPGEMAERNATFDAILGTITVAPVTAE